MGLCGVTAQCVVVDVKESATFLLKVDEYVIKYSKNLFSPACCNDTLFSVFLLCFKAGKCKYIVEKNSLLTLE